MITVLSAPTNLGLRPPEPGGVPGTAKAPEALRAAGLHERLNAADAGVVLPGRYVDDDAVRPAGVLRNERAIVDHARRLSARLQRLLEEGAAPLVLGGDCSLLVGAGLALAGRADVGLIHVDGHTDFRHPGNSDHCASLAGEDLAAAVGLHRPSVADVDHAGPYFPPARAAHLGCRDDDEELAEATSVLARTVPASEAIALGLREAGGELVTAICAPGYWLQVDVDVLDPAWMPAVDSPDAGGLDPDQLVELLRTLAPAAVGAAITVFDPDLDPDGRYAALLVDVLAAGLPDLGAQHRRD